MSTSFSTAEWQHKEPAFGVHPLKFLLWLLMISSSMSFAAFTSGYIVRQGEGNWLQFALPARLYLNSALILLSSFTMQGAYMAAKRDNVRLMQVLLAFSLVLGLAFLVGQWYVWADLVGAKVYFGGSSANPAGSFVYVLSGFHGFHIVCALVFLAIVLWQAFQYQVHSRSMLWIELCLIFWHFLGGLWLYLHLFLILNR